MRLLLTTIALVSGLHGTVMRSPTTPVCRVNVPCSAPAKLFLLRFSSPKLTRTARTDERGRYSVALAPGTYVVTAATRARIGGLQPRRVVVRAGAWTRANLTVDTGIR